MELRTVQQILEDSSRNPDLIEPNPDTRWMGMVTNPREDEEPQSEGEDSEQK